jgi:hypothetical protein
MTGSVANPHPDPSSNFDADLDKTFHFNADPDPTFHVNAGPDPGLALAPQQSDANLRAMVYRPFHGSILSLHALIGSVYFSKWLHLEPLQRLHFDFDADRIRICLPTLMRIRIRYTDGWDLCLDKMYAGSAPEHPVAQQLFDTIHQHRPNRELFHRQPEARAPLPLP